MSKQTTGGPRLQLPSCYPKLLCFQGLAAGAGVKAVVDTTENGT